MQSLRDTLLECLLSDKRINVSYVHWLLSARGVPADAMDIPGSTALQLSLSFRRSDMAEMLLSQCPLSTWTTDAEGNTPLLAAITTGQCEIAFLILQNCQTMKYTPNECATRNTVVCYNSRVHPPWDATNREWTSALMRATINREHTLMERLIDVGAHVCFMDLYGRTALMYATMNSDLYAIQVLMNRGSALVDQIHIVNYQEKSTVLTQACFQGDLNIVKYLVDECQADVHIRTRSGCTPFMIASKYGHVQLMRYLYSDCNADPHVIDAYGESSLQKCAILGHLNAVQYLVLVCKVDVYRNRERYIEGNLYTKTTRWLLMYKGSTDANGPIRQYESIFWKVAMMSASTAQVQREQLQFLEWLINTYPECMAAARPVRMSINVMCVRHTILVRLMFPTSPYITDVEYERSDIYMSNALAIEKKLTDTITVCVQKHVTLIPGLIHLVLAYSKNNVEAAMAPNIPRFMYERRLSRLEL
jgi:ankyrin repeat protein